MDCPYYEQGTCTVDDKYCGLNETEQFNCSLRKAQEELEEILEGE